MRYQHHLACVQAARDGDRVDLAHRAGELEVDAFEHAERARGDVVAGGDADLRAGHGRVGQALREQRLELDAQHAHRLLHRDERGLVGDAQALRVLRAHAARLQLRLDLRPRAVHEHQADAERGEQVDVVDEAREARALGEHLSAEADHEGAAAERVHVRRHLAQPAHEGFLRRNRAHLAGNDRVVFSNCKG